MKFKINGIEYVIKEVNQKEYKEYRQIEDEENGCEITNTKDGVYFGASHHGANIVFLDKKLPKDRKKRVLIHELTHCYISEFITHQEKAYNEEDIADICANSFEIIEKIVNDYFKEK